MDKSIIKDSSGLLLIEMLGASVIIILITLVLCSLYISSSNWMRTSRSQTLASSTAFSILEALRQNNKDMSWLGHQQLAIPHDLNPGIEIPAGMTACLQTWPLEENDRLLWVKIKLEWDGNKERKSLEMVTLLRNNSD